MSYFHNINPELLARISLASREILEVGCGAGNFAKAFKGRNPSVTYVGVELFEDAAKQAEGVLERVIVGDIERPEIAVALDSVTEPFDTLIFGDVLEHLKDPWKVLADLRRRIKAGGMCVACIPNVSHWSVLQQQLKGRWDYADAGLLDRTHLRFFTLETAIELFEKAGWTVLDAKPRILWPEKTEAAFKALLPLSETLGIPPENLRRDLSAFQWVIRAVNGPAPKRLHVLGLGIKKLAGVTDARVDYPLAALNTLPSVRAVWGAQSLSIPKDFEQGVFVLHRQFMNDPAFNAHIERMIAQGWLIVADMDDDPHHWQQFVENDFYAYRAAHAVTVSTEPLAQMVRQWNPNVQVFPNALFQLPQVSESAPKQGQRLRVFFGALNRGQDWSEIESGILSAAVELGNLIEFVVVHDRGIYDSLPTTVVKEFHPTLLHDRYMQVMASCDIALLPLMDSPFNRLKSDLKFIECCAAGVVPVCSPVVYTDHAAHRDIGVFATSSEEWKQALLGLCRNPEDIAHRRSLGLEYVKRERMHCHQVETREAWYRSLLAQRNALEAQRQQRLTNHGTSEPCLSTS